MTRFLCNSVNSVSDQFFTSDKCKKELCVTRNKEGKSLLALESSVRFDVDGKEEEEKEGLNEISLFNKRRYNGPFEMERLVYRQQQRPPYPQKHQRQQCDEGEIVAQEGSYERKGVDREAAPFGFEFPIYESEHTKNSVAQKTALCPDSNCDVSCGWRRGIRDRIGKREDVYGVVRVDVHERRDQLVVQQIPMRRQQQQHTDYAVTRTNRRSHETVQINDYDEISNYYNNCDDSERTLNKEDSSQGSSCYKCNWWASLCSFRS